MAACGLHDWDCTWAMEDDVKQSYENTTDENRYYKTTTGTSLSCSLQLTIHLYFQSGYIYVMLELKNQMQTRTLQNRSRLIQKVSKARVIDTQTKNRS